MKTTGKAIGLIILASFFAGTGQLLWKKVSMDLTYSFLFLFNPFLIMGVFVYFLSTILMVLAFKNGELSVLHPFLAISFIWVILVSPIIFPSETLGTTKIIGAILVFLGVSLIGLGGNK